jgi:hypothetical protein
MPTQLIQLSPSPAIIKYSKEAEMFRIFLRVQTKRDYVIRCSIAQDTLISMFLGYKGLVGEIGLVPR